MKTKRANCFEANNNIKIKEPDKPGNVIPETPIIPHTKTNQRGHKTEAFKSSIVGYKMYICVHKITHNIPKGKSRKSRLLCKIIFLKQGKIYSLGYFLTNKAAYK